MLDCSTTQLIGYLLNALDDEEREQIEQELARRPELRKKLERLKKRLRCLDFGRIEVSPPPGLAARTCQLVLQERHRWPTGRAVAHTVGIGKLVRNERGCGFRLSPLGDYWAGQGTSWSFADLAVGTLVVLIVVSLLFPALAEVRFRSRVLACRDNCRELYQAIHQYQDLKGMPGPEGIVRANLAIAGLPQANPLIGPTLRPCPGAVVDTDVDLFQESEPFEPAVFSFDNRAHRALVGYLPMIDSSEGWILSSEQLSLAALPLWRDRPHPRDCEGWSWNHEARGENWLFADGHVVFLPRHGRGGEHTVLVGMHTPASLADSPLRIGTIRQLVDAQLWLPTGSQP